jgi:hypothetical protein
VPIAKVRSSRNFDPDEALARDKVRVFLLAGDFLFCQNTEALTGKSAP